jgi:HEAT repeats
MRRWKGYGAGLVLLAGLTTSVQAQVSGIPGGAGATTAGGGTTATTAATTAAGAAGGGNIWSYFCMTDAQKQKCKDFLCNLPLVQLLGNSTAGLSAMTGGVLGGSCCPKADTATAADLALPPDSAGGAAGRVKADEAGAAKRRADVRYLSTADCHRWPEVQDALINALRLDRNECVRWEAALAFTRGCCCTKSVIRALTLTVSGSEDDGAPAETSERVKAAAHAALDHCLACYVEVAIVPPPLPTDKPKEGPDKPKERAVRDLQPAVAPGMSKSFNSAARPKVTMAAYRQRVELLTREQVVAEARRVRERVTPISGTVAVPVGQKSVFGLMQSAMAPKASGPSTPPPPQNVQAAPKHLTGSVVSAFNSKSTAPVAKGSSEAVTVSTTQTTRIVPTTTPTITPVPSLMPTTMPAATVIPSVPASQPAATVVTPTAYSPATQPRVQAPVVAPAVSTTPAPQASILPQPEKLLAILRGADRPEHRAWAADVLGSFDGWTNPKVVEGLVAAARDDKAASVRGICARNLGRMNVRTMIVISVMQSLKADPDATVRTEAEKALRLLNNEPVASLRSGQNVH